MPPLTKEPKVVHFFDCADVGKTLVKYGRAAGHPWWYRPKLPVSMRTGEGAPRFPEVARLEWKVRRTVEAARADLMHIHFGTRAGVANSRPRIPFVMHWHGTDIRTSYYSPASRPNIQWGADHAARVVFATPDLRQHALGVRPDAIYFPIPIDLSELPEWAPGPTPKIVFASRWDQSKGGDSQLQLLAALRSAVGPNVVIEGLDWGNQAAQAAALGATLVPKMPKQQYLRWLAQSHCVIGQTAGILATSELQAIAMGAPVIANLGSGYYSGAPFLSDVSQDELVARTLEALADPPQAVQRVKASSWVRENHGADALVPRLAGIYASVFQ